MNDLNAKLKDIQYKTLWLEEIVYHDFIIPDKMRSSFNVRPCLSDHDCIMSELQEKGHLDIDLLESCFSNSDLTDNAFISFEQIMMNLAIQGINIDYHMVCRQCEDDQMNFKYRIEKIIDIKTGKNVFGGK